MGEIMKGKLKQEGVKGRIRWIRLKSDSNLILSTKHHRTGRIIYYSQESITNHVHHRNGKDR
ncbi:hypothetical protein [Rossellomorea arthrocnemi]|uniref:hypothetical protein n=1 Tax=Rossellomorea arthrocnemi TaxID=2769542 RepID=UPI0019187900|nr:hypothetical protein [Rossellomorea arthrocnemi]